MPTRRAYTHPPPHGLNLTPVILAASYEYLRTTQPFHRWGLPPGSDMRFKVTNSLKEAGECCERADGGYCISVSNALHGHSASLLITMSHEMIHVRQFIRGENPTHGASFLAMAKQICGKHGFDLLGF